MKNNTKPHKTRTQHQKEHRYLYLYQVPGILYGVHDFGASRSSPRVPQYDFREPLDSGVLVRRGAWVGQQRDVLLAGKKVGEACCVWLMRAPRGKIAGVVLGDGVAKPLPTLALNDSIG